MVSWFSEIFREHETLLIVLGSVSVFTFAGTLLALPVLLIRIPEDYFLPSYRQRRRMGVTGFLFHLIKNLLGIVFAVMGFIMLFIPGQGLLTMIAGIWLMDLPGKRRAEFRLIRNRAVYRSIDYIRKKAGKNSLKTEDREVEKVLSE